MMSCVYIYIYVLLQVETRAFVIVFIYTCSLEWLYVKSTCTEHCQVDICRSLTFIRCRLKVALHHPYIILPQVTDIGPGQARRCFSLMITKRKNIHFPSFSRGLDYRVCRLWGLLTFLLVKSPHLAPLQPDLGLGGGEGRLGHNIDRCITITPRATSDDHAHNSAYCLSHKCHACAIPLYACAVQCKCMT